MTSAEPLAAEPEPGILLVVQDSEHLRWLQTALAGWADRFVVCGTAAEALRRLRDGRAAVVVLDLPMSGAAGLDLARKIRAAGPASFAPILFLDGGDPPVLDLVAVYDVPVVDHLRWPPEPAVLKAKVRGFLDVIEACRRAKGAKSGSAPETAGARLRAAEARLVQSEERFRLLVESVKDYAIFLLDPEGNIASWNAGAERIKGYKPDEVIGRHFSMFYTPEDLQKGIPAFGLRMAREQGRYEMEGWRVRKDGTRFWADVVITSLRDADGRLTGYAKVTRDLTERKQAEERARDLAREQAARAAAEAAERRSAFLAEATSALTASLDYRETLSRMAHLVVPDLADWCSVHVVEEGGAIRAVAVAHADPAREAWAREVGQRYPIDPDAAHGVPRVLRTGEAEFYAEVPDEVVRAAAVDDEHLRLLRQLGVVSYLALPLRARNQTFGVLSLATAESGRRLGHDERVLAEELARRAALALDNARLFRDAQEGVKARDRFLSIASHELRTPLNPLQLQIQMLLRLARAGSLNGALAGRVTGILEACERQVRQFSKLINDLLDISRIAAGRLELRREPVDLAALVREVVSRYGPELAQSGCELTLNADQPVVGRWDRMRLDQVVTNLLSNAMKYGRRKPIEIAVAGCGSRARLTVRDEGIGIAPEHQARIFERFERAVLGYEYGGLGMGLYIVRQIVEGLGGAITVASTPGQGSTFTVDLPCGADAEAGKGATEAPAAAQAGT